MVKRNSRACRVASLLALGLAVLALACPAPALAQGSTLWTLYSAEAPDESSGQGLPSSNVADLLSVENAVWVATDAGIGHYDGHTWRGYSSADYRPELAESTLPGRPESVLAVAAAPDGARWFGTSSGIAIQQADGTWEPFALRAELAGRGVTALHTAHDGSTWIGTNQGLLHYLPPETLLPVDAPGPVSSYILALAQDGAGRLWAGTQADGLQRWDGSSWSCFTGSSGLDSRTAHCLPALPGDATQVNALLSDERGGLWVGTRRGLAYYDGQDFQPLPDSLAAAAGEQAILALWLSPESGDLWLGLQQGVLIFDGQDVREPVGAANLRLGQVRAIRGDAESNVWLGTDGGVLRYRAAWEPLSPPGASAAAGTPVMALADDGSLWLGLGETVAHLTAEGVWQELSPLPAAARALWPSPAGEVWAGGDFGAARWSGGQWQPIGQLPRVFSLAPAGGGATWVGTSAGLGRVEPDGSWSPVTVDLPPGTPSVYALLPQTDGELWAGTSHGLLQVSATGATTLYSLQDGLPHQAVYSLYRDEQGQLWAGTLKGVGRWSGTGTPHFDRPEELNVLDEHPVHAIAADARSRLWFATERGCWVYAEGSLTSFTAADGLASSDVRGLLADRQGQLWLATTAGVQRYKPGTEPPWAQILGLRVGNQVIAARDGRIRLAWNQAECTALLDGGDLSSSFNELVFCYQMLGKDASQRCGNNSSIAYRLSPGRAYSFTASARDKDGHESAPVQVQVTVDPIPLTERPWFWPVALAVSAFALPTGYSLYLFCLRRDEEHFDEDVRLSLRQDIAGVNTHWVKMEIQPLGRHRWRQRLAALARRDWKQLRDPKESVEGQGQRDASLPGRAAQLRAAITGESDSSTPYDEGEARRLGVLLLAACLPNLRDHLRQARRRGLKLRLRLCLDGAARDELAVLPWEYLCDERLGFLAQDENTAVVRCLAGPQLRPTRLPRSVRALVVIACPTDQPPLNPRERMAIDRALRASGLPVQDEYLLGPNAARIAAADDAGLQPAWVASGKLDLALGQKLGRDGTGPTSLPARVGQALGLTSRPLAGYDILHFSGHASKEWRAEQGVVLLGEDEEGGPREMSGELLAQLLHGTRVPRLFFLNACDTADLAGGPSSAGLVPALTAAGVPAVIAMQYPVSDSTAAIFAETFYRELLRNGQADWAAAVARKAAAVGEGSVLDWGAPVMYLQGRDGFVFRHS